MGEVVEATYSGSRTVKIGRRESTIHGFTDPDDSVWGSAVLDRRLEAVKEGDRVWICRDPDAPAKKGRQPMKMFRVYLLGKARGQKKRRRGPLLPPRPEAAR